jgi:isopentenyldiphosphate isomerase
MIDEMIEIVDAEGRVLAVRKRSEVHGDPSLLHKVVHVLVFNDNGELLLQKRSANKDVAPGKWDTSVGGHVSPGEDLMTAALREMEEELGIHCDNIKPVYSYIHSNPYESELVFTHICTHNGPFPFNREEIDEVAFWRMADIERALGGGTMSSNLESDIRIYFSRLNDATRL